ncbi:MAG: polysaccharide pyruvyl transferase family protein, partial [Abditibacteriota bacterium]|nr:polysaccharide pyruvyl transferase family protein [Abditibacteriota bacterium]
DLVSVRDAESEGFLKSFGIAASLVPDPAFLCRKEPADGLPGIAGMEKDYFVICPRPYKDNSYLAPLRKAVSVYAEKTASTPLLVPMFGSEDMLIPGIAAADPDTGFAGQKGLIAGARLLIGVRLHSMIFAASENVPFVSVSYDPKTESFARANGITPLDINALQTETLLYEMQNARAASGKPDTDKLFAFAERIGEL